MKRKIYSAIFIVILIMTNNVTFASADSFTNKGIKLIGEVTATKTYYDGDILQKEDIIIDGYCIDNNGNVLNNDQLRILLPDYADINKHEYIISDSKDLSSKCVGTIDINVLPFDPTINFETLTIEPMEYNEGTDLNVIKDTASYNLGRAVSKTKFVNNIGKELKNDYNPIIDTTNLNNIAGEYNVPYTLNFFSGNLKNKYSQVNGTFKVIVKSLEKDNNVFTKNTIATNSMIGESLTPSLTATSLLLDTGLSYDINIDNKPVDSISYEWSSDNSTIAKVNSKSGVVTGIKNGTANITCKITKADKSVVELKSKVTVGIDENEMPVLTETSLDLTTGEKFDIDIQNKIAKSRYSWKSSNKAVATVSSVSGIVRSVSAGETIITCVITTPENTIIVLQCNVTVIAE